MLLSGVGAFLHEPSTIGCTVRVSPSRALTCQPSRIGGITMNDDSSTSRRDLLLGVGGAGLLAAGLATSSPHAAAAQGAPALTTQDISLAQAQAVVDAAIAASTDMGVLMDIAVVDAGANLKA